MDRGQMLAATVLCFLLSNIISSEAELQVGFYNYICPAAESIVHDEVRRAVSYNPGFAPGLLRMHFHDCFVRGCDGSVLIDSTPFNEAEKDGPPNKSSLRGFEVVDNIKSQLEAVCQGKVSCADILAFAARDSVALTGGPSYDVPAGRRDGRISHAADTKDLPGPTFGLANLTAFFAKKNLTQEDMITLSGAHKIGRSHCSFFDFRLYNFSSNMVQDPSLDPSYAELLKHECPKDSNDPNLVVPLNTLPPNAFDSSYYRAVLEGRGLFVSDQALLSTPESAALVQQYAADACFFKKKFAEAMGKMGQIEVLTGSSGEIRANCRRAKNMALARGEILEAQLQFGFYDSICPEAESIVKDEVSKAVGANPSFAAALLRMHFHDCFVRGCDASVLIDSTSSNTAEKDAPPNTSLRGFDIVDGAKSRLEEVCGGIVSCADILAFAARDSIVLSGGLSYQVPAGRRDGRVSTAQETNGNLPPPTFNIDQLIQIFTLKGFTQEEMVTLSGAHTIGVSHCSSFSSRLYNFSSTMSQDPDLDPTYGAELMQLCPQGSTTNSGLIVPMDPYSPNSFDTAYYNNVLANQGLFTSDQALLSTDITAGQVIEYANNTDIFYADFAAAMVKMGQIEVLTGSLGEIRSNCRVIN
ncbi:Peroxidase 5 [Ananas comosus]|uniref:Peroxidase 1 n=1 Tax=Ananas comosus TaxID=4615 RepID=A0A199UUY3_ANACO|nr:Peroxidase 5 [Ananas comosus]